MSVIKHNKKFSTKKIKIFQKTLKKVLTLILGYDIIKKYRARDENNKFKTNELVRNLHLSFTSLLVYYFALFSSENT